MTGKMQPTNMKDIFSELVNSGDSSRNPYLGIGREGDKGEQIEVRLNGDWNQEKR